MQPRPTHAQTPPVQAAPPTPAPAAPEGVQESKLDVFYLKDKDGKLQPVLGFTLEDFERMMATGVAREQATARTAYRIDKVNIHGKAVGDRAELSIAFTIFVEDNQWVRVPLRLNEAVLHGKTEYEGPGEHFVEYDAKAQEYVVWLKGDTELKGGSEKPHQLTLEALAPLTNVAGETRLKLTLPRALASELDFVAPVAGAVAQVSPGSLIDSTAAQGKSTRFRVLGLASDFTLAWRHGDARAVELPTVLEGTGALLVKLDGRSVHTQAQLTVRSFGGTFDTFRVRLPHGAVLLPSEHPDYTVRLVPLDAKEAKKNDSPMVEVRLRSATIGPVSVRLATAQSLDTTPIGAAPPKDPKVAAKQTAKQESVDLAGFEIVGAVRQWGHLAVQVVGDWQISWTRSRQVRQVEDVPAELWRDDLLASFEYFAQPFSLQARVLPRQTRMTAKAQHVALVGSDRVDLSSTLKYHISGAKAFNLTVDMPGWEFDEVSPAGVVDLDEIAPLEGGKLTLPLTRPMIGDVEIVVRAHRTIPPKTDKIAFALPKPAASAVDAATLVVQPADNVDLTPLGDEMVGLLPQQGNSTARLPPRQQPPLVYSSTEDKTNFAAALRVFTRTVDVAQSTVVRLGRSDVAVEERLTVQVAREPLESLSLDVPHRIVDSGNLEVLLGQQQLSWSVVGEVNRTEGPLSVRVTLPGPSIGNLLLVCRYSLEEEPIEPKSTATINVPLIAMHDADESTHELTVEADDELRVQSLDALWQSRHDDDTGQRLHLAANGPRRQIALGARLREARTSSATIVERAWIQSWLGEHSRQDRAVYRVTSGERHFTLRLPKDTAAVEVLVNGVRVVPEEGSSLDQLVVRLPESDNALRTATVELRYRFLERKSRAAQGALSLQSPILEKKVWPRRTFWQVVLPPDEQLWMTPANFTSENIVGWHNGRWASRPLLSLAELESWSGAQHDPDLPSAAHQYVFSTTDGEHSLDLQLARRSVVVLAASGLVLLVSLAGVYLPAVRRPAVLIAATLAVAAAAAIYPQAALLLAEAAALGILLAVLALGLKYWLATRRTPTRVIRSGPSSILERGSTRTQPHYRGSVMGSLSTTSAAKLSVPLPESEAPT